MTPTWMLYFWQQMTLPRTLGGYHTVLKIFKRRNIAAFYDEISLFDRQFGAWNPGRPRWRQFPFAREMRLARVVSHSWARRRRIPALVSWDCFTFGKNRCFILVKAFNLIYIETSNSKLGLFEVLFYVLKKRCFTPVINLMYSKTCNGSNLKW